MTPIFCSPTRTSALSRLPSKQTRGLSPCPLKQGCFPSTKLGLILLAEFFEHFGQILTESPEDHHKLAFLPLQCHQQPKEPGHQKVFPPLKMSTQILQHVQFILSKTPAQSVPQVRPGCRRQFKCASDFVVLVLVRVYFEFMTESGRSEEIFAHFGGKWLVRWFHAVAKKGPAIKNTRKKHLHRIWGDT